MIYYRWKKNRLGLSTTEVVWHELAAAEDCFTHSDYENTIEHLQNIKNLLKNSKEEVFPSSQELEVVEYIETVAASENREKLLEETFEKVSEILITDLRRLEEQPLIHVIKKSQSINQQDTQDFQKRVHEAYTATKGARSLIPLFASIALVGVAFVIIGPQAAGAVTGIIMLIIAYLDVVYDL